MGFMKYLLDSKMFEYDKHYRECRQLNKPFIKAKINPKHGHYLVQIDLMTCNYYFTEEEIQKMKNMTKTEFKFIQASEKLPSQEFSIDKDIAWFDGISSSRVDIFCTSLFELTQENH